MRKGRKIATILGGIGVVVVFVLISWMATETGIEFTSEPSFCGSCHVMTPMVDAYQESVHGGNNPFGVAARCTDCHTDHRNAFTLLWSKGRSGIHDIWVVLTQDEFALDWEANRQRRAEFVYDSGCLQCHRNLAAISSGHDAHAKYFAGAVQSKCVDCHENVGHKNLRRHLSAGWQR